MRGWPYSRLRSAWLHPVCGRMILHLLWHHGHEGDGEAQSIGPAHAPHPVDVVLRPGAAGELPLHRPGLEPRDPRPDPLGVLAHRLRPGSPSARHRQMVPAVSGSAAARVADASTRQQVAQGGRRDQEDGAAHLIRIEKTRQTFTVCLFVMPKLALR